MENENNFIFNLKDKLKYSKAGSPDNETASLEFRCPGMNEYEYISNLSQLVMNAIGEVQRANKEDIGNSVDPSQDEKKMPNGTEIKAILFSAKETKFHDISKEFKKLAIKTCTLDGTVKLTDLLLSRLSVDCFTRMVCEYIAFFIVPSLLSEEGE
jgi:hypothetical protein